MAVLMDAGTNPGRRAGMPRRKKNNLKVDMTPMVDLGFLLIAFFVMTTELSKPVTLDLVMPHEGEGTKLEKSNALTLLLGTRHSVYYYHGDWKDALATNSIYKTSFAKDGLGKVIREKQEYLDHAGISVEGRKGLMLLVKAHKTASYESVVNALDQVLIYNVKKYAIVQPGVEEIDYLERSLPD